MNKPTKEEMLECLRLMRQGLSHNIKATEAIRSLIEHGPAKPVPREFVERWVSQIIFLPLNAMEHWSVCLPDQLRDMLRELGHEVEEKEAGDE